MHIAILEPSPQIIPDYLHYLEEKGHTLLAYGAEYNSNEIEAIIIRSKITVDAVLLEKYPNLRYVLRVGVGIDRIDTELLKQKNIQLCTTPGSNAQAVAELTMRGILSLLRNTQTPRQHLDERFSMIGDELRGKTIGLVGIGNIGYIVYTILQAFAIKNCIVYDPYLQSLGGDKYNDITFVDTKEAICRQSDIISLHIPLLSDTKNFIGQQEFLLLKEDVKIINTSRGGIVDEHALIQFLTTHPQAGAYIDTREEEPLDPKKELRQLKNCIITPHLGSMTHTANQAMHYFTQLV